MAKHLSSSISCSRVPCCFSTDFCGLNIDDVDDGELDEEESDSVWEIVVEMRSSEGSEGPVARGEIDSMSMTWASAGTAFSLASGRKSDEGASDVVGSGHMTSISFTSVISDGASA